MNPKLRLAVLFAALALLGCKDPVESSAAGTGEGGAGFMDSASGTRTENVPDDTLNNMKAFSVTMPAKWKFQGVLLQGGVALCDSLASPVWRAISPDGGSIVEQMPQLLWAYGNGPKPVKGCLPQNGPISAQDLLTHVATMLHADYAGPDQMPEAMAKAVKQYQDAFARPDPFYAAHNLPAPKYKIEGAAALVKFKRGSSDMQGRLTVFQQCVETTHAGVIQIDKAHPGRPLQMGPVPPTTVDKCAANVTYMAAPAGQLAGLERVWDATGMGFKSDKDWGDAWVKRKAQQGQAVTDAMIKSSWDRFNAQQKEIAHTMAVQQQQHDQFLATMQEGTNRSISNATAAMNARSTAASDMVDYSLDRQTVMNTNTGAIYKITNQVTPGAPLEKVHGDGTPY
jgi:hypothetical protein